MAPSITKANSNPTKIVNDSPIKLEKSNLLVNGHVVLSDIPDNITLTPSTVGSFIGFHAPEPSSRHVASIGKLKNTKFMSIFRFKVWWTTHWTGSNGRDIENETQILILDRSGTGDCDGRDSGRPYVILLPVIEGRFRSCLQSGEDDNVDICVESGSTKVNESKFKSILYIHVGEDPYTLVKEAIEAVKIHLGTFKLLDEKTPPPIVDKFGWCTWDAFYLTVNPAGVMEGVRNLVDGGCPPGMLLIDDGWQSISHDNDPIDKEGMNHTVAGEQMPCRLIKFEENYKFRDYVSSKNGGRGMGGFVRDLKDEFKTVDQIYTWHALCGYWGGLRPGVSGLPLTEIVRPKLSPGLELTMEDLAVDKIVSTGVGLVPPERVDEMYEGLHSHLEKVGIDGVKVDVIHVSCFFFFFFKINFI